MCLKFPEFEAGCAFKLIAYNIKNVYHLFQIFGALVCVTIWRHRPLWRKLRNAGWTISSCYFFSVMKNEEQTPFSEPFPFEVSLIIWRNVKTILTEFRHQMRSGDLPPYLSLNWFSNGIVSCSLCYFVRIQAICKKINSCVMGRWMDWHALS